MAEVQKQVTLISNVMQKKNEAAMALINNLRLSVSQKDVLGS